jgi:CDP-diacylglycerol--glycerol-3-phosphate 3-phosphatidyltransferase
VARLLFRARLRPNHLTVAGLGVSIAAAYVFSAGRLRWGAVLLAVAGLFDFFDGAVARLAGSDSDYGAFLDSVVDRYSDLAVLLGILVYYETRGDTTGAIATMATLAGTFMVSYTKARAQSIGLRCEVGIMERPERLIALIAGATFLVLTPIMVLLAVLTNVTAVQRIIYTRRIARDLTLR